LIKRESPKETGQGLTGFKTLQTRQLPKGKKSWMTTPGGGKTLKTTRGERRFKVRNDGGDHLGLGK